MPESSPPGGFLPPEPSGPEPDLGERPAPPPPPPAPEQAPPAPGWAPPGPAEPGTQAPPPAWTTPQPQGPDNGPAVLGFCLSIASLALLLISVGLSSLISLGLAIPGLLQSRKGSRRVSEGITGRNASLASAGVVMGIVGIAFSALATVFWILIAVVVATDEEARREFEREFDRQYEQSSVTAILLLARIVGAALS